MTLHGRPLLQAVATATGIGPIIAIPGIIGYIISGWGVPGLPPLSLGYVNLGACLIAPLAVFAAPYGVEWRTASRSAPLNWRSPPSSPASSRGFCGRS